MPDPRMARAFMFIAGETSGDLLAAELVQALKAALAQETPVAPPTFCGAGGPKMAAAGVELAFDLTRHAVIGPWDVLPNYFRFRRFLHQLVDLALQRRPDTIVCVDFNVFNRRLAQAIRRRQHEVPEWKPRLIQFVSPQVWASRPGRAKRMAEVFDLLLSIFPFEKAWYARHAPDMRVEFVGHPMIDRHRANPEPTRTASPNRAPTVLLLPGSRVGELRRHLPVMMESAALIRKARETSFRLVVPNEGLIPLARELGGGNVPVEIQVGGLAGALQDATIAMASTGTVTMECAYFGVPTVTLYKTNWLTYEIARRIVTVSSLTMPNILAGERIYPEFIQHDATGGNLAGAALDLLASPDKRDAIRWQLGSVIASLGGPGACERAAKWIIESAGSASSPH